ncbi:MAG: hypothetical protein M5U25_06900 [Planctomycetota bacterium]|nr:hypothetical protein [Planctomycetota bacterium]
MNPAAALASGVLDLLLPRRCAVSGRPLLGEDGPVAQDVLREVEVAGATTARAAARRKDAAWG